MEPSSPPEPSRRPLRGKVFATAVTVALISAVVGAGTWSAFGDTTQNGANSFAAGTVDIGDNDDGGAMFALTGMTPSDPARERCIVVEYTGSAPAHVWLYGTTGGSGLATYLNLKVTRGTMTTPSFSSCTGFSADATEYLTGKGSGVVYDGTLAGYPDSLAVGGIEDPSATRETWSTGEKHAYRFEVLLQSDDLAQGKTATQTFTWEARNTP
jgi:hypothetical protein